MSLAFLVYAISVLPSLLAFVVGMTWCAGVVSAGSWFFYAMTSMDGYSNPPKTLKTVAKWTLTIAIFMAAIQVVIPSEKTAWLMVGGYTATEIYNSETGTKLKKIIANKLDQILDEQLKDQTKK